MARKSLQTYGIFLLFAVLWGATFPITKAAIQDINLYAFILLRFALASVIMLPLVWKDLRRMTKPAFKVGLALGLINTAIYLFETLSVHYTSVARAAFITGANVVLVPFIFKLMKLGRVHPLDYVAGAIFLVGLYLLTGAHLGQGVDIGALFALLAAFFIAISIVYIHKVTGHGPGHNENVLTFLQIAFVCPIPLVIFSTQIHTLGHFTPHVIWGILFCAIFGTVIPLFGQMRLQRHTSATIAALIFALEPVFALLIAYVFYAAVVPVNEVIGAAIMLVSTMLPGLPHLLKFKVKR